MKRMIGSAAVAFALVLGGYVLLGQNGNSSSVPSNPLGAANAQDAGDVDTSGIVEMQIGNPDAPVTIIEYASYTCPHCARFHAGPYKELKSQYIDTGKINFIYREVYFDRFGLWASAIARCAGPDKFFGITDLLYASQAEWSRAGDPAAVVGELRKIGRLAGLDGETLEACLQDGEKLQTLVAWFQQNADRDDVNSTPSFVINGTKHSNMSFQQMAEIIDSNS